MTKPTLASLAARIEELEKQNRLLINHAKLVDDSLEILKDGMAAIDESEVITKTEKVVSTVKAAFTGAFDACNEFAKKHAANRPQVKRTDTGFEVIFNKS